MTASGADRTTAEQAAAEQTTAAAAPQLVTVGRVSVDLYAEQPGAGFEAQQTFVKSVGGSPTNVAVAAARLGVRTAVVTAVGDDGLGAYVRARLAAHGVDTRWVRSVPGTITPLAVVALDPPESPTVAFYRGATPPDLQVTADLLPEQVVRAVPALWVSHATLAGGPVADAVRAWLAVRGDRDPADVVGRQARYTLLDLDHRPVLWPDPDAARRSAAAAVAACDVVVGNLDECRVAVGTDDPDAAADALLAAGVGLAVVKLGPDGVLLATPRVRVRVPAPRVDVVCGLGAGDALGGALVHGLLAGPPLPDHDEDDERRRLVDLGRSACAAGALVAGRLTCSDDMPTLAELTDALAAVPSAEPVEPAR